MGYVSYSTGYRVSSDGMSETKSNASYYHVSVPILKKYTNNSYEEDVNIWLMKIGDTYYCNDKKIEVTGSLEDSEFTIKSVKNGSYVFADLKFTRK